MLYRSLMSLWVTVSLGTGSAMAQAATSSPTEPVPYTDNLLDPDAIKKIEKEEILWTPDPGGKPRRLSVEGLVGQSSYNDEHKNEAGLSFDGSFETDDFGVWSFNGVLGKSTGDLDRYQDRNGEWVHRQTIWQRQLYLPGNWRMDNGFGVLNIPSHSLMRQQYRFFFPTNSINGVSLSAEQQNGLLLQGAYGRSGTFTGARLAGFETNDGHVGSLSITKPLSPQWTVGAALLATDGEVVDRQWINPDLSFEPPSSSRAGYAAAQWHQGDTSWQGNVIFSRGQDISDPSSNPPTINAKGVWMDGQWASPLSPYVHNYGLFYFEPGLLWGALPVNSDAQGGYYRVSKTHNRLNWNVGLDRINSVSSNGFNGTYATSYLRYQRSSVLGLGGSLNVRNSLDETAYAAQMFADRRHHWGQTRAQWDQSHSTGQGDKSWQLTLDQAWPLKTGSSLSTSAGYGQWNVNGKTSNVWNVAATGGLSLGSRTILDGTIRVYRSTGNEGYRGNDINVSLQQRLSPQWSAIVSAYQSRGYVRSPFIVDPLYQEDLYVRNNDRSMFVSLRYDFAAGSRTPVLGARSNQLTAAGRVEGRIFLDDNGDGQLSASEEGAANITVVLDGGFTTQTDDDGRYVFDRVSVGTHHIEVQADGLPLPWNLTTTTQTVDVEVRQTSTWNVPATR